MNICHIEYYLPFFIHKQISNRFPWRFVCRCRWLFDNRCHSSSCRRGIDFCYRSNRCFCFINNRRLRIYMVCLSKVFHFRIAIIKSSSCVGYCLVFESLSRYSLVHSVRVKQCRSFWDFPWWLLIFLTIFKTAVFLDRGGAIVGEDGDALAWFMTLIRSYDHFFFK